jgi:acyl carrier protein
MMKKDKLSEEITNFVNNQVGKIWWSKKELSRNTRIYEDLRIDGDDALDFFTAFEEEFHLDLKSLKLDKYFNNEGLDPFGLSSLIKRIKGNKTSSNHTNKAITLGDLEKAVQSGKWIDP